MNENTSPYVEAMINPEALEPEADCVENHPADEDEILVKDAYGKAVKLEVPNDVADDPA